MSAEEWRPIVGWPGYLVSDQGRVISMKRKSPRVLHSFPDRRGGYPVVSLSTGGACRNAKVHVLVAAAFIGPRPEGMDIRHLDGDVTNNRPSNLRYGTRSENMRDALRHGTHAQARKTHCPSGHPYSPENTRVVKGGRYCIECDRRHGREYRQRQMLRAAGVAA